MIEYIIHRIYPFVIFCSCDFTVHYRCDFTLSMHLRMIYSMYDKVATAPIKPDATLSTHRTAAPE